VKVSVVVVALATFVKVFPPSVLTCHCTAGAGAPTAAATKDTLSPALTTWLVGLVVTIGDVATVSVAVVVVALPAAW
jgi:hypothetical protein